MAANKSALTVKKVESLKKRGKYLDGQGLYLQISESGAKSWLYRYDINKKRREMGLGALSTLSLSEARERRDSYRKLLKQGKDPIEHRNALEAAEKAAIEAEKEQASIEQRQAITFETCAKEFIKQKQKEWKNEKHCQQWKNTLRDYVYPVIGDMRVGDVGKTEVLACLSPIWTKKTETATRVRQRIEAVLDYAKAKDYRHGDNPAAWKGNLEAILPKPSKVRTIKHHAALHYDKMPAFMSELRGRDGIAALALRFAVLTAARTSEVTEATWSEIDFENKIWTIPAGRMKAEKEHRVALSQAAIDTLEKLPRLNDYVFPGMKQDKPISNLAMTMVLRRMERTDITVHGFRSTFRDWIAETTNYPRRVAETALAHQLKDGAEKAYQRGDLIKKRFEMMEAWASYCDSRKAKVVRLPA